MLENFRSIKNNAMNHLPLPNPFRDETGRSKVTYYVTVTTGSMKFAGTDSNVSLAITGVNGEKTSYAKLDNSFHDDFERGKVDQFKVKLEDIGKPAILTLKHDEVGMFANWYAVYVTIKKSGDSVIYRFPINTWVTGIADFAIGAARLIQHEDNPILVSHRRNEIAMKKRDIKWRGRALEEAKGLPGDVRVELFANARKGYLAAKSLETLPRRLQLDGGMQKDFDHSKKTTKQGHVSDIFQGVLDKWENITDIRNVFDHTKLTKMPKFHQNWDRDEEFGRQMICGCDPTILKRCDQLPKKFPVCSSDVAGQMTRGMTLVQEMKMGNVYIIDLEILEGVQCGKNPFNQSVYFSCAPICLLYLNSKKNLVPIAIQLWQQPGGNNPIWTPDDSDCDWLLAKIYFRNAEINQQLIVEKVMRTHFVLEPFAIGIHRCLSQSHPVHKLLAHHLRFVCAGNVVLRRQFLSPGGALDRLLSYGGGSQNRLLRNAFRKFKFENLNIRKLLAANGTDSRGKIPNYFFRDDAFALWDCIQKFAAKVLRVFYSSNQDVKNDVELQDCIGEIRNDGFAWEEGKGYDVPGSFSTIEELIEFVTCIIFTSSCRYAAVTNGIGDVCINVPNAPLNTSLPPPNEKGQVKHETIVQTLPNKRLSCLQLNLCQVLSKYPEDQIFLTGYPVNLFCEDSAQRAIVQFKEELQRLSSTMRARNEQSNVPYDCLLPDKIPISMSI